jgi:hypothetical protein
MGPLLRLTLIVLLVSSQASAASIAPQSCYLYDASGNPLSSTAGALNVSGGGGGGSGSNAAAGLTGAAVPTSADYTGFNSGGNLVGVSSANPLPATISNFPATQPVSIASMPSTPVTGTFWQATQPVSIASMPSTPVTGTFWQATQPVSIASMPSTPVTGTFFQSVQPVSADGTKTTASVMPAGGVGFLGWLSAIVEKLAGTLNVSVQNASLAVTGTFWQATQPVSIASMPSTPVTGTFWQATQPVSGTVTANDVPPTLTKATQGSTGFSTQDLKDAGRSARTILLDGFAIAATTETLHTLSFSTDNGTATTGTSYSVTAAKRLRIQQIVGTLHTIAGNTTAVTCIIRVRANAAGAAIVTSPVQYVMACRASRRRTRRPARSSLSSPTAGNSRLRPGSA